VKHLLLPVLFASAACGGDEPFLVVTIEPRPAVHDIASLRVTLSNEGTSREDTFAVTSESFPATFSVTTPGRTGDLAIEVTALDENELLVGRGSTLTTTVGAMDTTATVVLDSADFVINTDFADDQFPSNDFESHGYQVSASDDGIWTAVYRDGCSAPCNMFARRFDLTGRPVETVLAAGTNGFPVSTELSDGFFTTPATATGGDTTIVVWNYSEPPPSTSHGIACRSMDPAGNGNQAQVDVAVETTFPFAVSTTALANGSFVVAWNSTVANPDTIKSSLVNAQCQPTNPLDVSIVPGTGGAARVSVAANGDRVMYAWVVDGDARVRVATSGNIALTGDLPVVLKTAEEVVSFVRVAPLGTGFALVVRWEVASGAGPGRLEMFRINNAGALMGDPVVISTRTNSDFDTAQGFSVAARADDGTLLVAWHACGAEGDGSGCGVFGRVLSASGEPVGEELDLATTQDGDQTSPSVVGLPGAFAAVWADTSGKDPDRAGSAVRGRVIYPPGSSSN
jgi:hypothetical protein